MSQAPKGELSTDQIEPLEHSGPLWLGSFESQGSALEKLLHVAATLELFFIVKRDVST